MGCPSGPSGSTIAGILLLLGLIFRNSSSNCSPAVMSTGTSSYGRSASFRKIGDLLTVVCRPVVKGDQLRYYSSLLNSVFDLGETLAKPLVGLATRIATKIALHLGLPGQSASGASSREDQ